MTIRIVFTGSECTGKSTLAAKIATHYSIPYVPEFLRKYCEQHPTLTLTDAIPIAKGQLTAELHLERQGISPLLCDSSLFASIVYNTYYYGTNPQWIEEEFAKRTYHYYFLCDIDIPWQADGQRDRPEQRAYMQSLFTQELNRRKLPYTLLSGPLAERSEKAIGIIESLRSTK